MYISFLQKKRKEKDREEAQWICYQKKIHAENGQKIYTCYKWISNYNSKNQNVIFVEILQGLENTCGVDWGLPVENCPVQHFFICGTGLGIVV